MGKIAISRRFIIDGIVTAIENNGGHSGVFLTSLKGWDETTSELVTVPRLFGAGSYIVEKHLPQREIIAEFTVADDSLYFPTLVRSLENAVLSLQPRIVAREIGGRTESLSAYVTAVSEVNQQKDSEGIVQVTLTALNPIKTIT